MDPIRKYQRYVYKHHGNRYATWLPGDIISLGGVGTMKNGQFRSDGDLRAMGIEFDEEAGGLQPSLSLSSVNRDAVEADVAGEVAQAGSLGLAVSFASAGEAVFEASDVQHRKIKDFHIVEDKIIERSRDGQWTNQWMVIDQVWTVGHATIVVACQDNARVRFSAALGALGELEMLAKPELRTTVAAMSGEFVQAIGEDVTPLYTCRRLNWLKTDVKPISTKGDVERSASMVACDLETLLGSWGE